MKIPASVSYSVRRLGLFLATLLFLSIVLRGWSFFVVLMLATLVSGLLGFFLLQGSRLEMARSVEARVKGLNRRLDQGAREEDAALDAAEELARQKVQHSPGAGGNPPESGEDPTRRT